MKETLKAISASEKSNWISRAKEKLVNLDARRDARKLALRVLALLEEKGMTQTELAEKMGVSRQQVTKIVKGRENYTFQTVHKLQNALGVKLMIIPDGHPQLIIFRGSFQSVNIQPLAGANISTVTLGNIEYEHQNPKVDLPVTLAPAGSYFMKTIILHPLTLIESIAPDKNAYQVPCFVEKKQKKKLAGIVNAFQICEAQFSNS
jgi:DNA-binding XRE family transcriptional regulator